MMSRLASSGSGSGSTPNLASAYRPAAEQKDRVALFVGNDITALLIANKVIQSMRDLGMRPALYLPVHKPSEKPQAQQFIVRELALYERVVPNEIIYPYLDDEPLQNGVNLTPNQISTKFGITVKEVANVNDPEFLASLKASGTVGGVSIRCYQQFRENAIEFFNSPEVDSKGRRKFLWNIHPGKLGKNDEETEYRGIWTPLRVMNNEETNNWWTLHEVALRLDTGRILERMPQAINYRHPMLNVYTHYADVGASMILTHLQKWNEGSLHVQDHTREIRGKLWSFPEPDELKKFFKAGLRVVDDDAYVEFCMQQFTDPSSKEGARIARGLRYAITQYMNEWYSEHRMDYMQTYGAPPAIVGTDVVADTTPTPAKGTPTNAPSADGTVG